MDLGRKRVQLIRYLVEYDSHGTSIPQSLTAYSFISQPWNPITSSTKPATKALLIAAVLKPWPPALLSQIARGLSHSYLLPCILYIYIQPVRQNAFCSQIRIIAVHFFSVIEFVFTFLLQFWIDLRRLELHELVWLIVSTRFLKKMLRNLISDH